MKLNATRSNRSETLRLDDFLPYRLSVLANTISTELARQYAERFGLTIPQWRVMAALGEEAGLSAGEVGVRTAMDKVSVSRAMAGLEAQGRIVRKVDSEDRRRNLLRLSAGGRSVYAKIVPLALGLEDRLVSSLGTRDRRELERLLGELQRVASSLGATQEDHAA